MAKNDVDMDQKDFKGSDHSDSEKHIIESLAVLEGHHAATLEDFVYYADQQYHANDREPLLTLKANPSAGFDPIADAMGYQVERTGDVPGPEIRASTLRHIWGPTSPAVDKDAPAGTVRALDISQLDPSKDENKDTFDRLLLRNVTWVRTIYLITSDVLGPFQGPFVYSQVGFVPATIVYVLMGILALLSGAVLNVLYLRLDSDRMPVRTFGMLCHRLWGMPGRIMADFLFIVQLIFPCGLLILTSAQSIGMIIDGSHGNDEAGNPVKHVCYTGLVAIFMGINILCSSMRTLNRIAWISRISLAMSCTAVIIITAFIFRSPPNYAQAAVALNVPEGPVRAVAFVEAPLSAKINGIMNMVYAYGGAMSFPNFMAEMRRPWDFYKSYVVAEMIVMFIYIFFGVLIYARQGQFTEPIFFYGVSTYSYQTFGNVIGATTGTIAAILYGNIVQKEVYHIVVRTLCKGPRLMSQRAFPFWMIGNVFIWGVAFLIGSAIPQVSTVSGIIGAIGILQFSYSFPYLMKFSFDVQVDAMKGDRAYRPGQPLGQGAAHRVDTWRQWSRWQRGLFTGNVLSKAFFLVLGLASLAMAALGIYGSAETIIATFSGAAAAPAFGCTTP